MAVWLKAILIVLDSPLLLHYHSQRYAIIVKENDLWKSHAIGAYASNATL